MTVALDVFFQSDIERSILAGLVATIQTAQASGNNVEFLRGALCAYQHQANMVGLDWPTLLGDARKRLDAGSDTYLLAKI